MDTEDSVAEPRELRTIADEVPRLSEYHEIVPIEPALVELATIAEQGKALELTLLIPRLRAACEQAVEVGRAWQRRYDSARARALEASRVIATTAWDQRGHRAAVSTFEFAHAELSKLAPRRRRCLNAARNASVQLEHDRCLRERHAGEIAAGQRALIELTALLRARIIETLDHDQPLPPWLVEAVGTSPPADTAAPAWWDIATQILRYRVTYSITDQESPLGARPGPAESAHRRQWFRELNRLIETYPCSTGPG